MLARRLVERAMFQHICTSIQCIAHGSGTCDVNAHRLARPVGFLNPSANFRHCVGGQARICTRCSPARADDLDHVCPQLQERACGHSHPFYPVGLAMKVVAVPASDGDGATADEDARAEGQSTLDRVSKR